MITVTRHDDDKYLSLRAEYRHKDAIKSLAPYPTVKWHPDTRTWLVDARMIDAIIHHLGGELAPLSVELVMTMPVVGKDSKPQPKRRPSAWKTRQAIEFGKQLFTKEK